MNAILGWLIVLYAVGVVLYLAGAVLLSVGTFAWDEVVPWAQGRRNRRNLVAAPPASQIPRRTDLRDSEGVDVWLERRGLTY